MYIFKALLFPFAVLYGLITRVRNHLFDIGHKRSFRFHTMIIGVGNLAIGGSGKTPMVEYLLHLLRTDYVLATLSRGYGRRTQGIRFASPDENAETMGDEPWQFEKKFGPDVAVVVGEDRVQAIPEILQRHPATEVIILDDAFQHRSVIPQLSILVTDYDTPFHTDHVLPMGRLRESRKGAKRADVIVVTKCPDTLDPKVAESMERSIRSYTGDKPLFFSGLSYGAPVPLNPRSSFQRNVILVSGIANPIPFERYTSAEFNVLHHFKFRDHYTYTPADLDRILRFHKSLPDGSVILTTEKDSVRLTRLLNEHAAGKLSWFILPVKIRFLKNGPDFDKIVLQSVEKSKKAG